jgi:hypothetical protein
MACLLVCVCAFLSSARTQTVNAAQKATLLQYLRGQVSTTPDLDIAGLEALESASRATAAAAADEQKEGLEGGDAKRQRISEEGAALSKPVSEWTEEDIASEECLLNTHLSVLLVAKKNFTPLLELYHKATGDKKALATVAAKEGRDRERERDAAAAARDSKRDKDGRRISSSAAAAAAPAAPSASSSSSSGLAPLLQNPRDPHYGVPIIVVPSAVSSVINMYNVKSLLENGVFEHGEFVRNAKASATTGVAATKESLITLSKASFYDASKSVKFQVLDDVTKLREEDWARVVAVFASGAAWQFSNWPKRWPNPAAIFENGKSEQEAMRALANQKLALCLGMRVPALTWCVSCYCVVRATVCAFHLHFDDEPLHPNIMQWRTHRLPVRLQSTFTRASEAKMHSFGWDGRRTHSGSLSVSLLPPPFFFVSVLCSLPDFEEQASRRPQRRARFLAHPQRIHRRTKHHQEAQHLIEQSEAVRFFLGGASSPSRAVLLLPCAPFCFPFVIVRKALIPS